MYGENINSLVCKRMNYQKGETSGVAVVVIAIVGVLAIGLMVMFFLQRMGASQPNMDGAKIEVQLPEPPQGEGQPSN